MWRNRNQQLCGGIVQAFVTEYSMTSTPKLKIEMSHDSRVSFLNLYWESEVSSGSSGSPGSLLGLFTPARRQTTHRSVGAAWVSLQDTLLREPSQTQKTVDGFTLRVKSRVDKFLDWCLVQDGGRNGEFLSRRRRGYILHEEQEDIFPHQCTSSSGYTPLRVKVVHSTT